LTGAAPALFCLGAGSLPAPAPPLRRWCGCVRRVFVGLGEQREDSRSLVVYEYTVLVVELRRVELAEDPAYMHCRREVLDFLYTRHGHVEREAA